MGEPFLKTGIQFEHRKKTILSTPPMDIMEG